MAFIKLTTFVATSGISNGAIVCVSVGLIILTTSSVLHVLQDEKAVTQDKEQYLASPSILRDVDNQGPESHLIEERLSLPAPDHMVIHGRRYYHWHPACALLNRPRTDYHPPFASRIKSVKATRIEAESRNYLPCYHCAILEAQ